MISFTLTFLLGDLWLQTFATLPSILFILCLLIFSLAPSLFIENKKSITLLPFAFVAGFAYTAWVAHTLSSWTLKQEWEGIPLIAIGTISSLPHAGKFATQFEFHLETLKNAGISESPNTLIRLTWPQSQHVHSPALQAGDQYTLLVKLKRIHAVQNPGGYDYEAWALQKGIRASGAVLDNRINKLMTHGMTGHFIMTLRQQLQNQMKYHAPHTQTSPWLMALITGERNGISQQDWQVLRHTGTNHLMAIGGLHIGLLAGVIYTLTLWCTRRIPALLLLMPAQKIAACAAFIMAAFYAAISGFSLPAQRATLMLSIFMFAILTQRKVNPWNVWSLALFCVLIMSPLTVLSESFWLSFGTIALIIYGMSHRLSPSGLWWKYARVQWVIGIGLIPVTFTLFQECSLISFIANSIAIPWLAMAILPFCLLSILFLLIAPAFSGLLLIIADKSLAGLWLVLSWLSQFHFATWHVNIPNSYTLICMVIGFVIFLLPAGVPFRILGVIWILPVFLYQPAKPSQGNYWMTLLDVGQGLSVVIETAKHTLVYDTGPKQEASFDMGESVVLPYLRTRKVSKIDLLVISHGDNDHIGGMQAILNDFPDTPVKTSVPDKIPSSHVQFCKAGDAWQWDGVRFAFLYPIEQNEAVRNDGSCVLLIENAKNKLLLTGDIEKAAEKDLLKRLPEKLRANIIVAPHHGSNTSGVQAFIDAVHPEVVLYATGYRNRYHFPHQSVVEAYEWINARAFNTVDTGAMVFKIANESHLASPERYRMKNKKYWYDVS